MIEFAPHIASFFAGSIIGIAACILAAKAIVGREFKRRAGKVNPPRTLTIQERIAALQPEIKEGKETA